MQMQLLISVKQVDAWMSIASQQVLQTGRNKVLQLIWISLTSSLPLCFQTYQLLPQALDGCLRPS